MAKYLIKLLALFCLGFTACVQGIDKNPEGFLYKSPQGYSLTVPLGYKYAEMTSSGYFYFGYSRDHKEKINLIEFHENQDSKPCSYEITGVAEQNRNLLENKNGFWGYASLWDDMKVEGFENREATANIECLRNWPYEEKEKIYVLCSKQDKKTIVICMTQQSDNPQLAEDIFKTFKWAN